MKTITEYIQKKHIKNDSKFVDVSTTDDADICMRELMSKYPKIKSNTLFIERDSLLFYFVGVMNTYDEIIKHNSSFAIEPYKRIDFQENLINNEPFMFNFSRFIDYLSFDTTKFLNLIKIITFPKFTYTDKFERDEEFGGFVLLRDLNELDIVLNEIAKLR